MPVRVANGPSLRDVRLAQEATVWDRADAVLYRMCADFPEHLEPSDIIAKVWIIGRAYAAPVERGRSNGGTSERFYQERVVPAVAKVGLDHTLARIDPGRQCVSTSDTESLLSAHSSLMDAFASASGRANRSLASKYLHFHRPLFFPILDARAETAMRSMMEGTTDRAFPSGDPTYRWFVARYITLRAWISSELGVALTPRQIDRLLLMLEARSRNS
jgi:hypothetical protein